MNLQLARVAIAQALLLAAGATAQVLPLPVRQTNAPAGAAFAQSISSLPLPERESRIQSEILAGNLPESFRRLRSVSIHEVIGGRTNSAVFQVTPDYLAVGTDADYFLTPMTPGTAQLIADRLACTLPTRKMVDAIFTAAELKLSPIPIPPSPAMTSVPVFRRHNEIVRTQRAKTLVRHPVGALVAGHKKDVVITPRLATNANKVAIYGWHQTNGRPIQPLYLGHTAAWVDYSHGIRLVSQRMIVNGETTTVARVLADLVLARLISDEGPVTNASYTGDRVSLSPQRGEGARVRGENSATPAELKFTPGLFNERITEFTFEPEVRIQINVPATLAPDKPVLLILYALPNGNTIEQTVGKTLQPGDDWHFDIQHIGAQTRFLRAQLTNQTFVIAYLEANLKSWPAWRRKHGDQAIPDIVARIKGVLSAPRIEVVLTGHSGGGSFTFGYLNTHRQIPEEVTRIAFLDSNYAYETTNHFTKLAGWLKSARTPALTVLAYHDSIALLDGKTFVSERGGTWGRSQAMLADFRREFPFTSRTNAAGLQKHVALDGRLQFLLQENPDQKILHTVQVERNGFLHAMLMGTSLEGQDYEYLGERAYTNWIAPD